MLITNVRRNMKAKFLSLWNKTMLRKNFLIERVNDQLKNISQIEHIWTPEHTMLKQN